MPPIPIPAVRPNSRGPNLPIFRIITNLPCCSIWPEIKCLQIIHGDCNRTDPDIDEINRNIEVRTDRDIYEINRDVEVRTPTVHPNCVRFWRQFMSLFASIAAIVSLLLTSDRKSSRWF